MARIRTAPGNGSLTASKSQAVIIAGILAVVAFYFIVKNQNGANDAGLSGSTSIVKGVPVPRKPVTISEGQHRNIPYYFCTGKSSGLEAVVNLVLLHGGKFTKEDWKTSGLLERFCNVRRLSVMAMDLPVSANHEEVFKMLRTLATDGYISQLPVALVTPSASGHAISDWLINDDPERLPGVIQHWIPVATASVSKVSDDQLKAIKLLPPGNFTILAIHGDQDKDGQETSERLKKVAGAKTVQIPGGHSCYMDSPDEFVSVIVNYLGLRLPS
jgi:hypothetical protein